MTKEEFIEEVQSLDDLYHIVSDGECYDWFGMEPESVRDDYINEWMSDYLREEDWRDVRNTLDRIDDDACYYMRDDWSSADDWAPMYEEDLERWKTSFIEEAEYNDFFEEANEEEEENEEEETPERSPSASTSWQEILVPHTTVEFEVPAFEGIYSIC